MRGRESTKVNMVIAEIKKILIEEHDFSEERVNGTLEKINAAKKNNQQKGLGEFF